MRTKKSIIILSITTIILLLFSKFIKIIFFTIVLFPLWRFIDWIPRSWESVVVYNLIIVLAFLIYFVIQSRRMTKRIKNIEVIIHNIIKNKKEAKK